MAWHGFDPFGDIIYGDQNILTSLGSYKRSHVINTPDIKKFDLKIVVQGIESRAVIPPCLWQFGHLRMKFFVTSYIDG